MVQVGAKTGPGDEYPWSCLAPSPVGFFCHCYHKYKLSSGQFGDFLIFLGIYNILIIFWLWQPSPPLPPVLLPEDIPNIPSLLCRKWKSISKCLICCFAYASKKMASFVMVDEILFPFSF